MTNWDVDAAGPRSGASGRKSTTIYDVAREAGVSHQSVSRFMRGFDQRRNTREKIERALENLEYKPNLTARSLVTGRSHRIGALTHEIDQVGPSQVLQGASAAARDAGYLLDIVALDMGNTTEIAQAVETLLRHDLAGVVALASTDEMRSAVGEFTLDLPILLVTEAEETPAEAETSELNGIPLVMRHLVELGHRTFAHISGPAAWSAARNRRLAYDHAVLSHNLRSLSTVDGDWSARSGYQGTRRILTLGTPTAIVAANDQMALGTILALSEHGLTVPTDVSVTGLDDTPEAAYYSPPLTTVAVDFRSEGRQAVNTLLQMIGLDDILDPPIASPRLIVRRSTAPPARQGTVRRRR